MKINPLTAVDFYKVTHREQYPVGTTMVYSNLTPRSAKLCNIPDFTGEVTWFGLQFFIKEFLQETWNEGFFSRQKGDVLSEYQRRMDTSLGHGVVKTDHIEALHDLGYLPICIKALPEGTQVPIKTPCMVIYNTLPEFFWLTNYLETALSAYLWKPTTSATIAHHYRRLLDKFAEQTGADPDFVNFQGHDFSLRGLSGIQDGALSGAGHLLSFVGTDSIPAIDLVENYYNGNVSEKLIGCSVPATEHSVICMGGKDDEIGTFRRLITELYPRGVVSIVSDTWDFWRVVTEYVTFLKPEILAREGKVVIRPDSGDPVEIICGKEYPQYESVEAVLADWPNLIEFDQDQSFNINNPPRTDSYDVIVRIKGDLHCVCIDVKIGYNRRVLGYNGVDITSEIDYGNTGPYLAAPSELGAVECLWRVFGGTVNEKGYKVLDPRVGIIYGDSITLERAEAILAGLTAKGFASSNIVLGIGSFTFQFVTRDTFGFAVKSTYGEVDGVGREIFKDPITDSGVKKSARGLLSVQLVDGKLTLCDRQPTIDTPGCQLREVFRDGVLLIDEDFTTIRKRVQK